MPNAQDGIVLTELCKEFVSHKIRVTALQNVSLRISQGEFLCIVGPSGCGKTTLLRILAGLDFATGGELHIDISQSGQPINSMVFQEQSVFPWLSVRDNVAYGLAMRGVNQRLRKEVADHYIEMIGLTPFAHVYPSQLSGGMKQRVSVARAFANDPCMLLMDEPFGALDEQNRLILQQELLQIWEQSRKTTVFITHSIDEALCLGDRVLVMTARPGMVKAILNVELPRPRILSQIRTTMQYNLLYQQIWTLLQQEVTKTYQS